MATRKARVGAWCGTAMGSIVCWMNNGSDIMATHAAVRPPDGETVKAVRSARERLAAMGDTARLVLLRHGESQWNASNQFTGWVDVDLTDKGRAEAVRSGELLTEHNLLPDVLYTSL